jgi:hypothetical protein
VGGDQGIEEVLMAGKRRTAANLEMMRSYLHSSGESRAMDQPLRPRDIPFISDTCSSS